MGNYIGNLIDGFLSTRKRILIMPAQSVFVDLSISSDVYLSYYQGQVKTVSARSIDGRRIQFPASILQKVVTHNGIHGRFAIHFDAAGKFTSIHRVE